MDEALESHLQRRIVDCWAHEQDIRRSVSRPGHQVGPVVKHVMGRMLAEMGAVVGRGVEAPDGSTIIFDLTGPYHHSLTLQVEEGRATPCESVPDLPTVRLSLDSETFSCLVFGRWALGTGKSAGIRSRFVCRRPQTRVSDCSAHGRDTVVETRMNGEAVKIAIGADHAGFLYKEQIKAFLIERGETVQDCGTDTEVSVDYPPIMRQVALAVATGDCDRGIVLGGSGNGEAIVANRVKGIRCALCWSVETAKLAREHNNANMISMGQRLIPLETALDIVRTWLETPFEGGRHARRIQQIDQAE